MDGTQRFSDYSWMRFLTQDAGSVESTDTGHCIAGSSTQAQAAEAESNRSRPEKQRRRAGSQDEGGAAKVSRQMGAVSPGMMESGPEASTQALSALALSPSGSMSPPTVPSTVVTDAFKVLSIHSQSSHSVSGSPSLDASRASTRMTPSSPAMPPPQVVPPRRDMGIRLASMERRIHELSNSLDAVAEISAQNQAMIKAISGVFMAQQAQLVNLQKLVDALIAITLRQGPAR